MEKMMTMSHGPIQTVAQANDGYVEAPGYFSGIISKEVVGEDVDAYELLYMDGTAEEFMLADADAAGEAPCQCMALESGEDGDYIKVLWFGRVRNDGVTYTEGGALYLDDTAGAITQTAPDTEDDVLQIVGYALSATEFVFNPQLNTDLVPAA